MNLSIVKALISRAFVIQGGSQSLVHTSQTHVGAVWRQDDWAAPVTEAIELRGPLGQLELREVVL